MKSLNKQRLTSKNRLYSFYKPNYHDDPWKHYHKLMRYAAGYCHGARWERSNKEGRVDRRYRQCNDFKSGFDKGCKSYGAGGWVGDLDDSDRPRYVKKKRGRWRNIKWWYRRVKHSSAFDLMNMGCVDV